MTRLTTSTITLAIALAAAACVTDGSGGSSRTGGERADGFGDGNGCAPATEMIAAARAQLVADEPDFYSMDSFVDELSFVEGIEDLNGDGAADVVVFPGQSYAGANAEQVVYLTAADGCATIYAGHFGASSVSASEDGAATNGVRDLTVVNTSGCSAVIFRYAFDGNLYVETGYTTEDLCEEEDPSDEDLAGVRAHLENGIEPAVSPELGLFVIFAPGAVDDVRHFSTAAEAVEVLAEVAPYESEVLQGLMAGGTCNLQTGDPGFSCDDEEIETYPFQDVGCFLFDLAPERSVDSLLALLEEYEMADPTDEERAAAAATAAAVTTGVAVTHAAAHLSYGVIDGQTYLLVVDLACFSCDA